MTPLRARFTLFAIMAIFLATAGNALFLQERSRMPAGEAIERFPLDGIPSTLSSSATNQAPPPSTQPPAESKEQRLRAALQRELARLGYADQLRIRGSGLRLAVLAYEFDNGMPLTGEPAEAILKHILFNPNQAPRGFFADRAEANQRLVLEIQKSLLGLGFFRGALSGRMDVLTEAAVKDFERHRGLPLSGRLSEVTLLELIAYSGQSLELSAG